MKFIGNIPTILLGALPFKKMLAKMSAENVKRVISLNETHELNAPFLALPKTRDYEAYGIERHIVNVCDFTGAPSVEEIDNCIDFIMNSPGKVYIHCKAGRCRSALIVVALLIKERGLTPREAFNEVKKARHHVVFHAPQWQRVREYE